MARFAFSGHSFVALRGGALFWPKRRALIVADLHFEKASWFARHGQMLPPYDTLATLTDLTALVAACAPQELWCLGDSFHDASGSGRLPAKARTMLAALTGALDWIWITGNHDTAITDQLGGRIMAGAEIDGLIFRHEADPAEPRPELSGHFHPKLRVSVRGRNVARRCFVASDTKLILPAFGALTGGLDVGHPEIVRVAGRSAQALVPVQDRMLRFPIAA